MSAAIESYRIARIDGRVAPFDWAWAARERAALDARWSTLSAGNAALFDGPVLLAHRWDFSGAALRVDYFETRFSRFMGWRDHRSPDPSVANCFAMAALRGADGAFLLGEMATHTANAGRIYFPAGTPDRDDIVDGDRVDLAGSALRELCEETGLTPDDVTVAPDWTVLKIDQRIACLRAMACREPAEAVAARIHAALETQEDRELARMHIVRRVGDIDAARMPPFIVAYLEEALG